MTESASRRAPANAVLYATLAGTLLMAALFWTYFKGDHPPDDVRSQDRIMLAVLPFENLSGEPDQEYFSEGLTEEMIAQLGQIRPARLGVIARTSAMQYKATTKRVDQIGRELGVGYVLEGSVRRSAGRVRITAQLVHVTDQTPLWSETYERDFADIFAIQEEVSGRIARSLELELLPNRQASIAQGRTKNSEAYEAYLKGRYFWNKRTEEGLRKGLEELEGAVSLDPEFPLAHVGIADSYNMLADYGALPPREALPLAKDAALRALALDPELAEAHTALTWAQWVQELDWKEAEKGFLNAIKLNPSYATSYQLYAHMLRCQGRHEEALAQARKARELDPLSLIINAVLGWQLYLARNPDAAVEQSLRTIEMDPNFPRVHSYLGWAYLQNGRFAEAVAELERARALFGDSPSRVAELAHGYAAAGRAAEAKKLLGDLLALRERRYVDAYLLARIYVALGEKDRAFGFLERAEADQSLQRVLLKVDPLLDPIREEPRFQELLRRSGLADSKS